MINKSICTGLRDGRRAIQKIKEVWDLEIYISLGWLCYLSNVGNLPNCELRELNIFLMATYQIVSSRKEVFTLGRVYGQVWYTNQERSHVEGRRWLKHKYLG
jgi:hypothetical protein